MKTAFSIHIYLLSVLIFPVLIPATDWFEVEQETMRWANDLSEATPPAEVYYFAKHIKEVPEHTRSSILSSCSQYTSYMVTTLMDPRYEEWQKQNMRLAQKKLDILKQTVESDPTAFKNHLASLQLSDATRMLFEAIETRNPELLQSAVDSGANLRAINGEGLTALHKVKDPQMASMLIKTGCDLNVRESRALMTPLFFQEGAIMELLVRAGADVNAISDDGNTPLLWYTYSNYREGIRFLIQNGATTTHQNNDGSSILDIAEKFGSPDFIQFVKTQLELASN